jgi:hypothetical protein
MIMEAIQDAMCYAQGEEQAASTLPRPPPNLQIATPHHYTSSPPRQAWKRGSTIVLAPDEEKDQTIPFIEEDLTRSATLLRPSP